MSCAGNTGEPRDYKGQDEMYQAWLPSPGSLGFPRKKFVTLGKENPACVDRSGDSVLQVMANFILAIRTLCVAAASSLALHRLGAV